MLATMLASQLQQFASTPCVTCWADQSESLGLRCCCRTVAFLQSAVQLIKDTMDKKFGPAWQVVVGKGFSYDVQHEVRTQMIACCSQKQNIRKAACMPIHLLCPSSQLACQQS